MRTLDGNHLSGTEHRLHVLRGTTAGALPGQALVLLDPQRLGIDDVFPCPDGHPQERALWGQVLPALQPRDLLIDGRNFGTAAFLTGRARRGRFLTRQHGRLPGQSQGRQRFVGRCPTGRGYEQAAVVRDPETGQERTLRRITIRLRRPTRDGDTEGHLLTHVPPSKAGAVRLARLYQQRWCLETTHPHSTSSARWCGHFAVGYNPGVGVA